MFQKELICKTLTATFAWEGFSCFVGQEGYSQHKTLDAKLLDYQEKLFNSRKGLSNFTSVLYWVKGSNK